MFKKKEHKPFSEYAQKTREIQTVLDLLANFAESTLTMKENLDKKINLLAEKLGYKFEIEPAKDEQLIIKKK